MTVDERAFEAACDTLGRPDHAGDRRMIRDAITAYESARSAEPVAGADAYYKAWQADFERRVRSAYARPTPEASDAVALEISHANCNVPGWEYATTEGPRKAWRDADVPPEGDGWEPNREEGCDGWERFEYTEESYWRRRITKASDV